MFERFLTTFPVLPDEQPDTPRRPLLARSVAGWDALMGQYAGRSFGGGIYRLHSEESGARADEWVQVAFPEIPGGVRCFGYDWLGVQYALDSNLSRKGEPIVLSLEFAIGDIRDPGVTFAELHDDEFVENPTGAPSKPAFEAWAARHPETFPLEHGLCVGHRVPLFLGGADDEANEALVDLDVHLSINAQIRRQIQGLPDGAPVSAVRLLE
jgi:hypothetical protein